MRCCCSFGTFAMIGDALLLLLVGFCWGGTNPLLRRGAEGIQRQKASSLPRQLAADVLFLARRWDYVASLRGVLRHSIQSCAPCSADSC
eukprot:m.93825 g.93825  ORF g.93825 m.93825 type:complete len:89 (-) comp8699_c0_seq4:390-656(-)